MIKELLEQLAPLDAQIAALRGGAQDEESQMAAITAHASELAELAVEEDEILRCCGPLTAEDRVFLARHPERPHIDETINALFTDFFEQCGDRQCREDSAILGGIARFHGMPVTVIGHRKGSTLEENMACNFGMPGPEGYRKALRLMKQAEKLNPEQRNVRLMKEIQDELHLDRLPMQIECFDNSNIQGSDPVAACVVFKKAKPSKQDYRKYNIKTVVGADDYASMKEVVKRRYQRAIEENNPLPDLLITDGGKGQMNAVKEALNELNLNLSLIHI